MNETYGSLFTGIGYGRRRRERTEIPREITDEIVVELLATLGPDLSSDGETILRRLAQAAPSRLAPAVENLSQDCACRYRRGFLAELTEAYYLDEETAGSLSREDGIRRRPRLGVAPLSAAYRGPFLALFRTDLSNGVVVLNRMHNHAALVRARTLTDLDPSGRVGKDPNLDAYRTELRVSGTQRSYVGDWNVWRWYRGTGVGPYPCMSALQALEQRCDQIIRADIPLADIVPILLDGCENLAMLGLVVGLLVRHIEKADRLLDPYLVEAVAWFREFDRVAGERTACSLHHPRGSLHSSGGLGRFARQRGFSF
ncbi:MAG: hypothetical protein IPN52_15140 [Micrococcales bacterium]|nr:hypothetical protein [Micrococcales bacterium]